MLFSEPKIPQLRTRCKRCGNGRQVSVLFSEPKIPQFFAFGATERSFLVSVLFSEPKIPQFDDVFRLANALQGFSALQRAENSSIARYGSNRLPRAYCFSALQRAENSSILKRVHHAITSPMFQCSSASRKFLNYTTKQQRVVSFQSFSALQRAENSSMPVMLGLITTKLKVSVLFSEPKIPQFTPVR